MKKMFVLIKGIFLRLLMYITMVVPKQKNLYIFGAWFGQKFSDNSKALYLYALKSTDLKCIWICNNDSVFDKLKKMNLPVCKKYSIKGIYYQARAKVAFTCVGDSDLCRYVLGNCIHINLWHGVGGGKKIGYDDFTYKKNKSKIEEKIFSFIEHIPLSKQYFVATSQEMKKVFMSAFYIKSDHFIFSGQPRNDMFYDTSYKISTFPSNIFENKRVILYMPTHRKSGAQKLECNILFNLEDINSICKENNCIFVIKKHFYHAEEKEYVDEYSNIIDITNKQYDTNELLLKANLLISDYSSVTADYLLLDRPILYYCFDLDEYLSEDREVYWDYDSITPGPKAHNYNELQKYLLEFLSGKDDFKLERKRVRDMFYDPECQCAASEKILAAVENIIMR